MDDRNTDTSERTQWGKLAALTGLHLVSDMFPGYIPAILTPIREAFGLSLTMGIVLMGEYFGFCGGAWLGACLVESWGFKGLLLFLPVAVAAFAAVPLMRFRLAVESNAYAERHHGNLTIVMYVACAFFAVSGFLGLSMLRRNGARS
jgi:hypothetical protein